MVDLHSNHIDMADYSQSRKYKRRPFLTALRTHKGKNYEPRPDNITIPAIVYSFLRVLIVGSHDSPRASSRWSMIRP